MTCPNCAKLAAELAELREALGLAEDRGAAFAVRTQLGLTEMNANLVLRLYSAAGRPVQKVALEEELQEDGGPTRLKVHIWQIRCVMGADFVETVPGFGYRLTPLGRARVYQAINRRIAA